MTTLMLTFDTEPPPKLHSVDTFSHLQSDSNVTPWPSQPPPPTSERSEVKPVVTWLRWRSCSSFSLPETENTSGKRMEAEGEESVLGEQQNTECVTKKRKSVYTCVCQCVCVCEREFPEALQRREVQPSYYKTTNYGSSRPEISSAGASSTARWRPKTRAHTLWKNVPTSNPSFWIFRKRHRTSRQREALFWGWEVSLMRSVTFTPVVTAVNIFITHRWRSRTRTRSCCLQGHF